MRKVGRIGERKVMLETSNDEMFYDSKTARTNHGRKWPTELGLIDPGSFVGAKRYALFPESFR